MASTSCTARAPGRTTGLPAFDPASYTTMELGAQVGPMPLADPARLPQLLGDLKK